VGRTNHGWEWLVGVGHERAADELNIYLLRRRRGDEAAVLLRLINEKGRQILRFNCHPHCIVGLNVLTRRCCGTGRDIILLKPIGRDRQTLPVGLRLQHFKQLLLILIAQSRRIRAHSLLD
jgi:hypothetical protein